MSTWGHASVRKVGEVGGGGMEDYVNFGVDNNSDGTAEC